MKLLYEVGIRIFSFVMYLRSLTNTKAKAWITGQKQEIKANPESCIWIHSASLGEYNQAKPLVSLLERTGYTFVFTFFSPSGFENVKTKYPKYYLPLDTQESATKFIERINPSMAIFVRSEFWFNHIMALEVKEIPLVCINCHLDRRNYLFKWYGKWFLNKLKGVRFYYTTQQETSDLLSSASISQNLNLGDTKVDQVLLSKSESRLSRDIPVEKKVILCGSLEPGDRAMINNLYQNYSDEFQFIIVPHEHSETTYEYYRDLTQNEIVKYSMLDGIYSNVIYVGTFGILSSLFQLAWVSYIGGGFDKGIHNMLESCVENTPMIIGPRHQKFPEAQDLINTKAALLIKNTNEISAQIEYLKIEKNYKHATFACAKYIETNKGATKKIFDHLQQNILN